MLTSAAGLDADEKDELIRQFKLAYDHNGLHDLKSQVPFLSRLAEHYESLGVSSENDWVHLIKVIGIATRGVMSYDSIAIRIGNRMFGHLCIIIRHTACTTRALQGYYNSYWKRRAYEVQTHYWDDNISFSYEESVKVTDALKEKLQGIRDSVGNELGELSPLIDRFDCEMEALRSESNKQTTVEFISKIQSLSHSCNKNVVKFTAEIMEKGTAICGAPPCQFSAVAIGSMARGETTPYSDLEFFFLVENTDSMTYFRRLAMTVYFIIGNLGETKLKYMNIEELNGDGRWFDDMSISGFKIDGLQKNAGNIPTGNGTEEQTDKFIQTVSSMVEKYRQVLLNPDSEVSKMGDLSAMLSSTVLLFGDQHMYNEFTSKVSAIEPSDSRRQASLEMLESDIKKFDFLPDGTMTRIKDVKGDFYRFPSLVIFDIKICHSISSSSVWDTLDKLGEMGALSLTTYEELRAALSMSIYARLSAYCYHSSQDDRMTIIEPHRD